MKTLLIPKEDLEYNFCSIPSYANNTNTITITRHYRPNLSSTVNFEFSVPYSTNYFKFQYLKKLSNGFNLSLTIYTNVF